MSIDNPTCALDRAMGAEERANERICELEDALQLVAIALIPPKLTQAARAKLIAQLRPEFDKVMVHD